MRTHPVTAPDWPEVRDLWRRAARTSLHYALATTNADGSPHVTPIGSVRLLREPGRAMFHEVFADQLARNLDRDPRICVLAVDSSVRRFVTALWRGRFRADLGLRLSGTAGPRRPATAEETDAFLRSLRPLRRLKGHDLLWSFENPHVRELELDVLHPVRLGAMTRDLEQARRARTTDTGPRPRTG